MLARPHVARQHTSCILIFSFSSGSTTEFQTPPIPKTSAGIYVATCIGPDYLDWKLPSDTRARTEQAGDLLRANGDPILLTDDDVIVKIRLQGFNVDDRYVWWRRSNQPCCQPPLVCCTLN